ncbi:MAG: hypothetical protein K2L64_00655 [Ureaplasma sp.]|nr:hypothetical protein [Ureaplasma sp.]
MANYNTYKFRLTAHSIERAKQRLDLKNKSNLEVEIWMLNTLNNFYTFDFEDRYHFYYKVPDRYGFYFVVQKINMLVKTVSKISDHKKIILLNK